MNKFAAFGAETGEEHKTGMFNSSVPRPIPAWRTTSIAQGYRRGQGARRPGPGLAGDRRYVHDIAKAQVYCVFAEVLLGEASFSSAVK